MTQAKVKRSSTAVRWRDVVDPERPADAPCVLSTEIRWIVPGVWQQELQGLLPRDRPETLVDTYVVVPGMRAMSLKRRSPEPQLVVKRPVGAGRTVDVGGRTIGEGQCWEKAPARADLEGDEVVVHKTRWRRGVLEVVELEAAGQVAWSVAVTVRGHHVGRLLRACDSVLAPLLEAAPLEPRTSTSYGDWVAALV